MRLRRYVSVSVLLLSLPAASFGATKSPTPSPGAFPSSAAGKIDVLVNAAIAARKLPGAVVIVGHDGNIVFRQAYGMRSLEPAREAMTVDTVFDLASLTKVLITAPAVMQLVQQGRLHLDDPVAHYLPAFAAHGKASITIRQLLTHTSGLPSDLPLDHPWSGKEEALRLACASTPVSPPGTKFRYSDVNYMILGVLVEKVSGLSLDAYANQKILGPLGLKQMLYLPPKEWYSRIAPTEYEAPGKMLRGIVDDPSARRMNGVAGDAGIFATADDLAAYAQALLDRLAGRASPYPLERATVEQMVAPIRLEGASQGSSRSTLRGLGWDIHSAYSSPRGRVFAAGSFGHTGYTGTSLWIDPASDSYVILLSNAVHPKGHTDLAGLRSAIATTAAMALLPHAEVRPVQTGIDVLEEDRFAPLAALAAKHNGRLRLGLLTNQTGVDALGRRTADVLARNAAAAVPGLQLKLIFSPEHGIRGTEDKEGIANATDPATGVPILSLYGLTDAERRPALDTLRQLDAVVIDLQDAGVRFYTYETLVHYFLEAGGRTGMPILLLDRPNPLGGELVQGPLSDPGRESYVDAMPVPVRHGMTLGELALYFNREGNLGAPLTVVAMRGWQRSDWFDATGLEWVNPSPNLRSLDAATLYPALGLIETTNISVGRGTSTPFAFLGAPWMDGPALARFLTERSLTGLRFEPVTFTPKAPYPYANQQCHGVRIVVTDRNAVDTPELGVEIASALHHLYASRFDLDKMDRLLLNRDVLDAIRAGEDPRHIAADWQPSLRAFNTGRMRALLY